MFFSALLHTPFTYKSWKRADRQGDLQILINNPHGASLRWDINFIYSNAQSPGDSEDIWQGDLRNRSYEKKHKK